MSNLPPSPYEDDEPTRMGDATDYDAPAGRELPRRSYDQRMKPPPPPPTQRAPGGTGTGTPRYTPPPPQSQAIPPTPRPPRRRNPDRSKADSGLYLPWWSLVVLVLVVGCGAVGTIFAVNSLGGGANLGDQTPPVIVVTNPANVGLGGGTPDIANLPPSAIPIITQVPIAEVTATPRPASAEGCPLNTQVEVINTEGVGLSVRREPVQGNNILYTAADGEEFIITGGPERSVGIDGDTIEWCRIQGANRSELVGWAAVDFLNIVE